MSDLENIMLCEKLASQKKSMYNSIYMSYVK